MPEKKKQQQQQKKKRIDKSHPTHQNIIQMEAHKTKIIRYPNFVKKQITEQEKD
jgi:hypothetical protein